MYPVADEPVNRRRVHVSIVGTGMGWTIAEADADIALHGRKLRGCFETSGTKSRQGSLRLSNKIRRAPTAGGPVADAGNGEAPA